MTMDISLITICWNSVNTLERTVQSVLAQTVRPRDYVFVDGGSTDGTLELADSLVHQLEAAGVRSGIIHQERVTGEAGIPSAWNQGMAKVTGDVIGLINSDDWYEPEALETVSGLLADHPKAGMLAAPVRFISPRTGEGCRVFRPVAAWQLPFRMILPHPGLFVRRITYENVGSYDTRYRISADYDFVWRCHEAGIGMAVAPEPLVNMELGGLANSSRALARQETLDIARRHCRIPVLPWLAWLARTITGR